MSSIKRTKRDKEALLFDLTVERLGDILDAMTENKDRFVTIYEQHLFKDICREFKNNVYIDKLLDDIYSLHDTKVELLNTDI